MYSMVDTTFHKLSTSLTAQMICSKTLAAEPNEHEQRCWITYHILVGNWNQPSNYY